ncbi:MAG: hypothetical protein IKV40_01630 [Clostridia bacterium]|nr:hypothetical protein [Clostridia bacterium]MBR5633338.1 hypothetical protein [Clostridia bacterium]
MKKSKIFRIGAYVLTLLGAMGAFVTDRLFAVRVKEYITSAGEVPMAKENFTLFFRLSMGLCALLMALQLLTLAIDALSGKDKRGAFSRVASKIYAPLSMAVVISLAVFFAYLSADKLFPVHGYIISLGICESVLFLLPMAVRSRIDERLCEK